MGSIYRIHVCSKCRKLYYNKAPAECGKCGCKEFSETSWCIDCRVNGNRIRKALPGATHAEAKRILRKLEGEAIAGEYGLVQEKKITLKQFIEKSYLPLYVRKLKSARNIGYELTVDIIPEFGDKLLSQIKTVDVECWRVRLSARGLKDSSINRLVSRLSSIFTCAVRWGDTKNHPIQKYIRCLDEDNQRDYYLKPEQYTKLIDLVDQMPWIEPVKVNMKAAITLAIQTGLRKGNLFDLEWGRHVDMKNRRLAIPGAESKNKEPIHLPMFNLAYQVLESIPRQLHSPYVFTSARGGKFIKQMQNHWKELKNKMTELDPEFPTDFRWHDLRATTATWLKLAGVSDDLIMRILNLKSTRVLERYRHHSLEQIQEAGNKIEEFFTVVKLRSNRQENKS